VVASLLSGVMLQTWLVEKM